MKNPFKYGGDMSGLANELSGVKRFASDFIGCYGLRAASNVQRAAVPIVEAGDISTVRMSLFDGDALFLARR